MDCYITDLCVCTANFEQLLNLKYVLDSWAFLGKLFGMSLSLVGIGLPWASQAGGTQQVEGDQHVMFFNSLEIGEVGKREV